MRSTTACRLLLLLLLLEVGPVLVVLPIEGLDNLNWQEQAELELKRQSNKVAYCRALQHLQLQQYEESNCLHILKEDSTLTGELLMDSMQRCGLGWELFGTRCRKRV